MTRHDRLARRHQYPGGVWVPVVLFLIGAAATLWAADTVNQLETLETEKQKRLATQQLVDRLNALTAEQKEAFLQSLKQATQRQATQQKVAKQNASAAGTPAKPLTEQSSETPAKQPDHKTP